MTPEQQLIIHLLAMLDKLTETFDDQGATSQSTQLSALLDDYYIELEAIQAARGRK